MLRVMIVDDEKPVLLHIASVLQIAGADVVTSFTQPRQALTWFTQNYAAVDAVFLDVKMPFLDGFAVADVIQKLTQHIQVVFVTAYDQHAVRAFEIEALDYIVKPLTIDRVKKCLRRISVLKKQYEQSDRVKAERNSLQSAKTQRWELQVRRRTRSLLLKKMSGKHLNEQLLLRNGAWEWLDKNKISFFAKEKSSKYVKVIADGKHYEAIEKLVDFLYGFSEENWMMCYRAMYVNVRHIDKVVDNGRYNSYLMVKKSDEKIPVSRSCFNDIVKAVYERDADNKEE